MRLPTPLISRLAARGVLALLLLFAQQHAVLHWLSHSIEATHAKAAGSPAANDHCDDCLGMTALGAGATSSAPLLVPSCAQHSLAAVVALASAPPLLRLGFRSRAPPILS
jgi:hypothetical protein